jgi:hypothetical protein
MLHNKGDEEEESEDEEEDDESSDSSETSNFDIIMVDYFEIINIMNREVKMDKNYNQS